jgi:hypothetical protein
VRRTRITTRLIVAAMSMATVPAIAGNNVNMDVVPLEWRDPRQPLSMRLELGQVEIRAAIKPAPERGGGLIGGLVEGAAQSSRNKGANSTLDEIRDALDDFDADAVVSASTRSAFAAIEWLHLLGDRPERMTSDEMRARAEEAQPGMRLLVLNYAYELSPDLSIVTIEYKLMMARPPKPGKIPDAYRDWYPYPAYTRSGSVMTNFAGLPVDLEQRKTLLAANGAKLLKDTLRDGFARAAILAARTVEFTQPQIDEMQATGRPKVDTDFGFKMMVIEGGDNVHPATVPIVRFGPKMTVEPDTDGVLLMLGGFRHYRAITISQKPRA